MQIINKTCLRPPNKRNKKFLRPKNVLTLAIIFFAITWLSGLDLLFMEKSFSDFVYPLEVENEEFQKIVKDFRTNGVSTPHPINNFYSGISFSAEISRVECEKDENHYFLILAKSAPQNVKNREAIRSTWKKQFIQSGISAKILFFTGNPSDPRIDFEGLKLEQKMYKDIVRIDYLDNYYNNTIKTVLEMRFAVEHCPNFQYAFLVDDDYFVNLKNLHKFTQDNSEVSRLYAGFTFNSKPLRHRFFNKWFIDLEEYEYSRFPTYVTAGNILLSKEALMDIYYSTFFVKPFRFDDIYVSICAKKLEIQAIHSDLFKFWVEKSESSQEDLIAAHGYGPERLLRFWKIQNEAGVV